MKAYARKPISSQGDLVRLSSPEQVDRNLATPLGVSVVICTHNGAKLLPETLARLKKQQVRKGVRWEVLVIDNASTDDSAGVARQCWGDSGLLSLRVICEPRLGLSYARERAFDEAQYEIVSFVDDDNWVAADWVATASDCMTNDLQLGAIVSSNTAVADIPLPEWFHRHAGSYGAGEYPKSGTNVTWLLIGAGMTIRKSAWHWLRNNGFRHMLSDRFGTNLTTGGDVELGCAIRLSGWTIRAEPRLKLKHYMTGRRLQWRYFRRLKRGVGESGAVLRCYFPTEFQPPTVTNRLRSSWWVCFAKQSWSLMTTLSLTKLLRSCFQDMEGDDEVAEIETRLGSLIGLWRLRSQYTRMKFDVAKASWRRIDSVYSPALSLDQLKAVRQTLDALPKRLRGSGKRRRSRTRQLIGERS